MKMNMKCLAAIALSTVASVVSGIATAADTVVLGEWTTAFSAAKAKADSEHIPMLVFWGNPGCSFCKKMKAALETDEFKEWQAARKIVMVKVEGLDGEGRQVQDFAENSEFAFPYLCIYWNKADGQTVKRAYPGRNGKMPVKTGTLARQLIDSVELDIGAYDSAKYIGGTFGVSNVEGNRLEAEIGLTTYVDVPLVRETAGVATNRLVGRSLSTTVVWGRDELSKTVRYTLPTGYAAGELALTLYDADGTTVVEQSAITCTNRANSISYPYWLGERTAKTLNYGEWTMDFDVAKEKVAAESGSAYTLVNVGGDLWCPYCQGVAKSLYADAAFTEWAKSHNVALVSIDQPRAGTQQASLLTYVEDSKGVSGAFYRSSKMIDDASAQAVIARNEQFSFRDYLLPSTGASRISNPTALLFNKAGEIVGRLNPRRDANKNYATDENLARLNELLAMADAGKTGESHKDSSTTTLTHTVGASSDMTMQVNDNVRFYKLNRLAAGKVSLTATAVSGNSAITLELFTSPSGSYSDKSKNALASATNAVAVAIDAATIASNVYLRVGAYSNATTADIFSSTSTSSLFDVTVTSTLILMPEEVGQTVTLGTTSVAMEITEGNLYKLSGFDAASLATYFTASNGLYVAKTTNAAAALDLASETSRVSYQLWKPGRVQFAKASDRKMEMDGSGTISVTRTGGKSGAITVNVSVDGGANGTKRVSVSPATLTWTEGDTKAKTINYTIQQISGFNKDEVFTLSLAADDETLLGAQKTFALTISDTDDPVLPSDSISVDAFVKGAVSESYAVYNIKGTGALSLKKSGSLPSGVKIAYDKKTRKVVLSGTPKKTGTYTTTVTLKERRDGKYVTGPETTFKIVVRDPSSASSMAGYGVANAYYGKSVSATLPIIDVADTKRMTGLLTVAISASNRVKATFAGANGKKTSFSNVQASYDPEDGALFATLTKNGAECSVELSVAGKICALYSGADDKTEMESPEVSVVAASSTELARYAGSYTVTFPRVGTDAASVAAGTAYTTLAISAKGVAKYSGVMPNGKTLSGSVKIIADGERALLPLFKASSGNTMSALLAVVPDAQTAYADGQPAIILAESETQPFWSCTKGVATTEELKAYGGYYSGTLNIEDACHELYSKSVFTVDFDKDALDWSASAAKVVGVPTANVDVVDSTFSLQANKYLTLKLASRTGVVTGKATLSLENGRAVKATIKGVVLLGWEDCNCGATAVVPENRPFVSGICTFSDTVDGTRITRSIPIDLNVKPDCED